MKRSSVLIAEDEAIVAEDLRLLLRDSGCEVVAVVGTGQEAIDRVDEFLPDLLIMDVRLQGTIDGVEAGKTIRSSHDTPILYLTAFADDALLEKTAVTEPCCIAFKPFLEEDLMRLVRKLLFGRKSNSVALNPE
jgi:two-component system, response regulator PdtaR